MMRERVRRQLQHLHTALRLKFLRTERTTISNLEFCGSVHIRTAARRRIPDTGEARRLERRRETPAPLAFLRSRGEMPPRFSAEPASRWPSPPPVRTPELIWRKPEKVAAEAEPERMGENVSRASAPSSRPSFHNPPQQLAWHTQSATAARSIVLDGATVDRLAEDVIRRVERHIRIERERRGM